MTPLKQLRRAIVRQPQTLATEYLGLALDYYIVNGRAPDTIAVLKRALGKFEQAPIRELTGMNTIPVRLGLAQEVLDLLRSFWGVADDDIQKSLIKQAMDELVALDPTNISYAPIGN